MSSYPFIIYTSAAKKAIIQTEIVVHNVRIIKHLNQLTYSRFFVDIIQEHRFDLKIHFHVVLPA